MLSIERKYDIHVVGFKMLLNGHHFGTIYTLYLWYETCY